jgi:hypothetical protein
MEVNMGKYHLMDLVLAAVMGFILGWLCFQVSTPLAGYLPY